MVLWLEKKIITNIIKEGNMIVTLITIVIYQLQECKEKIDKKNKQKSKRILKKEK